MVSAEINCGRLVVSLPLSLSPERGQSLACPGGLRLRGAHLALHLDGHLEHPGICGAGGGLQRCLGRPCGSEPAPPLTSGSAVLRSMGRGEDSLGAALTMTQSWVCAGVTGLSGQGRLSLA